MSAPTVLLYNLDSEKGRRIKLLCLALKLKCRSVCPDEYSLPLGELAEGGRPESGGEQKAIGDEMLLMAGLSNQQMNALLLGFRRKKTGTVALKAVLTETNREWDSVKLHRELKAEHEAMHKGQRVHGAEGDSHE